MVNMVVSSRALNIIISFCEYQRVNSGYNKVILPVNICKDVYNILYEKRFEIEWTDLDTNFRHSILDIEAKLILFPKSVVIYNHTYGTEHFPETELKNLKLKFPEFLLIDDRCLCIPQLKFSNQFEISDLTVFSTGSKKQCDLGFGGFGFAGDWRFIKIKNELLNTYPYISLDDYFCLANAENKSSWKIKQKNFDIINSKISQFISGLDMEFNNWRYNILLKNRDDMLRIIFQNNLFASSHYSLPDQISEHDNYKNANFLALNVLNIFIDKYTNEYDLIKTVDLINRYGIPFDFSSKYKSS